MNDVMTPAAPTKINFTEFNVRQEQGKPHFVRLNDSVVKRLERQLIDHPPVTGSERFGLLFGSIEMGDQCTIAVEDFEPTAKLEDRIRNWTSRPGSSQRIVGYYRSHRQPDFAVDPVDRGIFERCFPKDSRLTLLVKPPAADVGTAMFFLGENGQFAADRATVEFPFNLQELGAEDAPAIALAPVPAPKPVPPPAPKPTPKPAAVAAPKPAPAPVVTPAAPTPKAVAIATPKPTPAPAPVVSVPAPTSKSVVVPALKPAAAAAPQPASAPAVAPPARKAASGAGGVILKIAVAGGVVIASVFGLSELKVFNGVVTTPAAPVDTAPSAAAADPTPAVEASAAEARAAQPERETVTANPVALKPQPVKTAAAKTAVKPNNPAEESDKPQSATPVQQTSVAQNTTPDPSLPQQRPLAPAASPVASTPRPTTPAPVTPQVNNQRQPAPPIAAPLAPALTPKPLEASAPITPPHAIRQVSPVLSDKVRRTIAGEATVRVKVNVDAAGKVTSAEPVGDGGPVSEAIAGAAVDAVRHWQFEPARRGGERVPGDVVLSFIFRK